MQTKKTFFACLWLLIGCLCLATNAAAQAPSTKAVNADTLLFTIQKVQLDSSKTDYQYTPLQVVAHYDFEVQYPYYKISSQSDEEVLSVGDFLQVKLQQLPDSGYLYFFSVDEWQNINLHFKSDSCTTKSMPLIIPDGSNALGIDYAGTERFVFWYAAKPIANYEKLAGGLELTMGRFMQRIVNQLGRSLVLPSKQWKLLNNTNEKAVTELGLQLLHSRNQPDGIIPIVIEFDVQAAPTPAPTPKPTVTDTVPPTNKRKE